MELTAKDVSTQLKVTEQYARKLMKDGKVISFSDKKIWKTTQNNLNEFIEREDFSINPDDRKRKSTDLPEIVALSFFSGGMGLDIGIQNSGIKPLLACEINKDARATIVRNDDDIALLGDIWEANPDKIKEFARIPSNRKIDLIIGGPPCQAFSTAGNRKGFEDSRGDVLNRYLDIIEEIMPTYAVLENVRGFQTTEAILNDTEGFPVKGGVLQHTIKRFEKMGYTISFNLYNTANFGTPQKRERFVIIAKLGDQKVPYLVPTHSENATHGLPRWRTFGDVVNDIQGTTMQYVEIPKKRIDWFRKIPEGGNWKSLSLEDQKEAMGNKFFMGGGKTGFFRRLSFNEPSPTLVTFPTMPATDLIHPVELRAISVEEYARVQGFPDDWEFCGTISEKYKQIGNAVPIHLGEAIGKVIINDINKTHDGDIKDFKFSRYKYTSEVDFPELYAKNFKSVVMKGINQLKLDFHSEKGFVTE